MIYNATTKIVLGQKGGSVGFFLLETVDIFKKTPLKLDVKRKFGRECCTL